MRKLLWIGISTAEFAIFCLPSFGQGPAYPYSVNLSFTASTGTITGYNMYRAPYTTACGTFAKLNSTPFTATTYTDANPPQGNYCYAATALDGTNESGFSNIDSNVVIPPAPPTGLGVTVAGTGTNNATFAWTQSTGTVNLNTLYCAVSPSAKPTARWQGASTTTHSLTLLSGTHPCFVTASLKTAESGKSNQVNVVVP